MTQWTARGHPLCLHHGVCPCSRAEDNGPAVLEAREVAARLRGCALPLCSSSVVIRISCRSSSVSDAAGSGFMSVVTNGEAIIGLMGHRSPFRSRARCSSRGARARSAAKENESFGRRARKDHHRTRTPVGDTSRTWGSASSSDRTDRLGHVRRHLHFRSPTKQGSNFKVPGFDFNYTGSKDTELPNGGRRHNAELRHHEERQAAGVLSPGQIKF